MTCRPAAYSYRIVIDYVTTDMIVFLWMLMNRILNISLSFGEGVLEHPFSLLLHELVEVQGKIGKPQETYAHVHVYI